MDSVRNATFRIGFPPPYVSLRSIRCKSLDRHMAASSILKWHSSLQEGKSLSRYNAASFYPKMAKLTSEGKSLDRHMAAFSILKWQNSLQEGKSSLQNATRGFPYIRKWHSSLQVGILCLTGFLIN